MKRLVLLLLVGLGWAAMHQFGKPKLRAASTDAFPFPTRDDHDAVSLADAGSIERWCGVLGCSETELRSAVAAVGKLLPAIRDHLGRAA